jgi:hypothetical protein
MKKLIRILVIFFTFHFSLLISSCTQDGYEKGDGVYSLMQGDFVEVQVGKDKKIVSLTTDDGVTLPLTQPYSARWVTKADTLYRCMLYYNKVKDSQGRTAAEIISISPVPCASLVSLSKFQSKQELKTDPVKLQSVWMSKSGKYLNMYLQLMIGNPDDTTAIQQIAIVCDTVYAYPDSTRTCSIILHHDQNHQPEYYSTDAWLSLPITDLSVDTFRLSVNTYSGPVVKTLPSRN